jgi:hypothetical protein
MRHRRSGRLRLHRYPTTSKRLRLCPTIMPLQRPSWYVSAHRHARQPASWLLTVVRCLLEVGRVSNNLCIDYPKESRSGQVRVTGTASAAITFTIVALRCVARLMRTKRLWWDDWMALIATVSQRTLGHNVQAIGTRMLSQSLRFCSQPQLVLRSRVSSALVVNEHSRITLTRILARCTAWVWPPLLECRPSERGGHP